MTNYKLVKGGSIQRLSDSAFIPPDPANRDYADYLAWAEAGGVANPADAPVIDCKSLALAALDVSDSTALRCFKSGIAFPAEWQNYITALRGIVKSGAGPLPDRPAYPAGT